MRRSVLVALWGVALLAFPAGAQERLVVLTEPGTPVVATEIVLPVGPAQEGSTRAGLAYLSARTVLASVRPTLDSLGARANISPQKDLLSFSLIAAPDAWEEATRVLMTALFRDPADGEALVAERRDLVAELRGRTANPADAATREMDRAFFGASHPWGRPTIGTPESVERLTLSDVQEFIDDYFTPDRALAAVVGPVVERSVQLHLAPMMGAARPAPLEMVPFRPAERPVRRDYDSITTWVGASFRFPEGSDEEGLRFLAYLASETLSFSPAQRSIYDVWSEVVPRVGGGEIRLQVVIPPEEAEQWAERVQGAITELATERMLPDVFDWHVRRYRGLRLMSLIAPEDRAREAARQLLVRGEYVGIDPDLDGMTQERVRAAALSLSSPTIVLLGPTLD